MGKMVNQKPKNNQKLDYSQNYSGLKKKKVFVYPSGGGETTYWWKSHWWCVEKKRGKIEQNIPQG